MDTRWVRVVGDGAVYLGPCVVRSIIMVPDGTDDYAVVYDGRDATSGKPFLKVTSAYKLPKQVSVEGGVPFDQGIYVDGSDAAVETTVVFTPMEC